MQIASLALVQAAAAIINTDTKQLLKPTASVFFIAQMEPILTRLR